ncbi:HEAT repeat domain-containing protein [Halegenticoccus soli]|uniref:HEAT repeat domain-containing protein n=1 Tax=Halegenticoccus soli TaxID=1985678 RepID=UPI000C6DCDC1|nr:HEAT repeat domain-containing protein [Halegenticoccus soli]
MNGQPPSPDALIAFLDQGCHEEAIAQLERLTTAETDIRKEALRRLRTLTDERGGLSETLPPALTPFLTDEERSVRLTAAKLFVAVAEATPGAVVGVVDSLAGRLADDEEFYYVRARSAEALGYVAIEHPDEVASPEILADLRIGLSFDEPEVKVKLAKALEYVALGDPNRLRHQVSSLAEHLDDESELVRYHLCTALVAVGCEHPETLAGASGGLAARLTDENAYVRGRAAEALGLLARSEAADASLPEGDLAALADDEEPFVAERANFAVGAVAGDGRETEFPDGIGTVEAIRGTTEGIAEEIRSPDGDGECPHCGLALPGTRPPTCPRCGAPY